VDYVYVCSCRKSPASDGEKRDGDDINVDNIAMADDLNEVRASQCAFCISCIKGHVSGNVCI